MKATLKSLYEGLHYLDKFLLVSGRSVIFPIDSGVLGYNPDAREVMGGSLDKKRTKEEIKFIEDSTSFVVGLLIGISSLDTFNLAVTDRGSASERDVKLNTDTTVEVKRVSLGTLVDLNKNTPFTYTQLIDWCIEKLESKRTTYKKYLDPTISNYVSFYVPVIFRDLFPTKSGEHVRYPLDYRFAKDYTRLHECAKSVGFTSAYLIFNISADFPISREGIRNTFLCSNIETYMIHDLGGSFRSVVLREVDVMADSYTCKCTTGKHTSSCGKVKEKAGSYIEVRNVFKTSLLLILNFSWFDIRAIVYLHDNVAYVFIGDKPEPYWGAIRPFAGFCLNASGVIPDDIVLVK